MVLVKYYECHATTAALLVTGDLICRLPSFSMKKAKRDDMKKAMASGVSDGFSNRLINTEISEPKPI